MMVNAYMFWRLGLCTSASVTRIRLHCFSRCRFPSRQLAGEAVQLAATIATLDCRVLNVLGAEWALLHRILLRSGLFASSTQVAHGISHSDSLMALLRA